MGRMASGNIVGCCGAMAVADLQRHDNAMRCDDAMAWGDPVGYGGRSTPTDCGDALGLRPCHGLRRCGDNMACVHPATCGDWPQRYFGAHAACRHAMTCGGPSGRAAAGDGMACGELMPVAATTRSAATPWLATTR